MPETTETEIRECILSRAGESFGAGNVTNGGTSDFGDLTAEQQATALNRAREWCDGLYDSTHISKRDADQVNNAFEGIEQRVENGNRIRDLAAFRTKESVDTQESEAPDVTLVGPDEEEPETAEIET